MSVTLTSGERRSVVDILDDLMSGLALERPNDMAVANRRDELLSALERARRRSVQYEDEIRAQPDDDSDGSVNNDDYFDVRNPPRTVRVGTTKMTFCGKHCDKPRREPARPGDLGIGTWKPKSTIASDWRDSTENQMCSARQINGVCDCPNRAKYLVQVPDSEI